MSAAAWFALELGALFVVAVVARDFAAARRDIHRARRRLAPPVVLLALPRARIVHVRSKRSR